MNLKIIEDRLARDNNLPPDWHWDKWQLVGPVAAPWGHEFTGCRCPLVTRGPRAGRPNWKKKTGERTFQVSTATAEQWAEDYRRESSHCSTCLGAGQEAAGWSQAGGTRYQTCRTCGGTGRTG